jgi:uncharacterized membrane protein YedE/YeeE
MSRVSSLLCGLLFGAGLAASGMTDTAKVIGFLDIFGQWDPDLLFVMGSAVLTTVISFYFILKRPHPIFGKAFFLPKNKSIDRKVLIGAILFGIGWGLYGYCPGPAVAAIVYLQPVTAVFLIAMFAGMFIGNKVSTHK